MSSVRKLVLDVLKPHHPDAIHFAKAVAAVGAGYNVKLVVMEMDEKTETLRLEVSGTAIDFELVQQALEELGASLHSIDEVEVVNDEPPEQQG